MLGKTETSSLDPDIRLIGDYTGLNEEVINNLHHWNELGKKYYHFKFNIDFINVFLSIKYIYNLLVEAADYIENVKFCTMLEKGNPDIDFTIPLSYSFIKDKKNDIKKEEDKTREIIENDSDLIGLYHDVKKNYRRNYFELQDYFLQLIKTYGELATENYDIDKYYMEQDVILMSKLRLSEDMGVDIKDSKILKENRYYKKVMQNNNQEKGSEQNGKY